MLHKFAPRTNFFLQLGYRRFFTRENVRIPHGTLRFLSVLLVAVPLLADPVNQLLTWTAPWEVGDGDTSLFAGPIWLTPDVGFDPVSLLYVNPHTGVPYGVYAPPGVTPIVGWMSTDDEIAVPYGPGVRWPSILWASVFLDHVIADLWGDPLVWPVEESSSSVSSGPPAVDPVPEPYSLVLFGGTLIFVLRKHLLKTCAAFCAAKRLVKP